MSAGRYYGGGGKASSRPSSLGQLLSNSAALLERTAQISAADWERAVGARLAQKARPERLSAGVLMVRVPTSTWAQELSLLSPVVLERLRAAGHRVEQLRFSVSPVRPPPEPPVTKVRRAALPASLIQSLSRLDDPELRRLIGEAAAYCLARDPGR